MTGGLLAILGLAHFTGWQTLRDAVRTIGPLALFGWCIATIAMRFILVEALTRPVKALGHNLRRLDAFWIGWTRTFYNQLLPFAGVAYSAVVLSRATRLDWSQLAALASPQYVLASLATALVGAVSVILNASRIDQGFWPLLTVYLLIALATYVVARLPEGMLRCLPLRISNRALALKSSVESFRSGGASIATMMSVHSGAILLRWLRLWILFAACGVSIDWQIVLLLSCIGEVAILIQLTPGGIGVREGTLVLGGMLLGLDLASVATVAIIDRVLTIMTICLITPFAFWQLRDINAKPS